MWHLEELTDEEKERIVLLLEEAGLLSQGQTTCPSCSGEGSTYIHVFSHRLDGHTTEHSECSRCEGFGVLEPLKFEHEELATLLWEADIEITYDEAKEGYNITLNKNA